LVGEGRKGETNSFARRETRNLSFEPLPKNMKQESSQRSQHRGRGEGGEVGLVQDREEKTFGFSLDSKEGGKIHTTRRPSCIADDALDRFERERPGV